VLHCPDCDHISPALSSQQEVLQHIIAHTATSAAAGKPCYTLHTALHNGRYNTPAAFGYSSGEALDKPAAVETLIQQILARITVAAALHILIATRPAPGRWRERQREAEAAAAGHNPYASSFSPAAAAATAAVLTSSGAGTSATAATGRELGLAELLPWRLWAQQCVVTDDDSADDPSLMLWGNFARPSLASLRSKCQPCLLDLLYSGPFILPGDMECGFVLERLVALLLRFRAQKQQQQQQQLCGVASQPGEAAAAAAAIPEAVERSRRSQRAAAAAAAGGATAVASPTKQPIAGSSSSSSSSSSLTEADVQQLLSELLATDIVFQHVPSQQRVHEFLQQIWPNSSTEDVAAAPRDEKMRPYVSTHLMLCCWCGDTPASKKLRGRRFYKCTFCVTCICGGCLARMDSETTAAAAGGASGAFYCPFCEDHPDVAEFAAAAAGDAAGILHHPAAAAQHQVSSMQQQQQQELGGGDGDRARQQIAAAGTVRKSSFNQAGTAAGSNTGQKNPRSGSGSSDAQAVAAAAAAAQDAVLPEQQQLQDESTARARKRDQHGRYVPATTAAAAAAAAVRTAPPGKKRQHLADTELDVLPRQQQPKLDQSNSQQQQQTPPPPPKQQQQPQQELQQQLEEADQAADQCFLQLMMTAGNSAEAQAVLTATRMKKCSLVSSFEETGDINHLIGLQVLAHVVGCMQQASAAALPLLLRCMAEPVDEGAAAAGGSSSSSSGGGSNSVLDLLLCCWLREVQLTGCSIQQSVAAAAEAVAAGFAGAGSSSGAAAATATLQRLVAGLCQLLLQLITQSCESTAAAGPAAAAGTAAAAAAAAAAAQVVQLSSYLMLGTSLLLLHWPKAECCRQLLCQQASFWRQLIWINAQNGAAVQVSLVLAQISSQVGSDMLKQHGRAVKAAAAAAGSGQQV
jgi:hypothetical protein